MIQDQWQRRKQTKEERRAAKKAKLDPENYKSALDVHKENERKRKRELDDGTGADQETNSLQKLKEGLARPQQQVKKPKLKHDETKTPLSSKPKTKEHIAEDDVAIRRQKTEKRRMKRERKKEKNISKREKKEAKKQEKQQSTADKPAAQKSGIVSKKDSSGKVSKGKNAKSKPQGLEAQSNDVEDQEADEVVTDLIDDEAGVDSEHDADDDDSDEGDAENDEDDEDMEESSGFALDGFNELDTTYSGAESMSSDASSEPETPTFDVSGQLSSASSSSSIVPPSEPDAKSSQASPKKSMTASIQSQTSAPHSTKNNSKSEPSVPQRPLPQLNTTPAQVNDKAKESSKFPKLTEADSEKLKERLESRLAALRAARKADGPDGKPARNRQDLIDARRQKQERRKQHKKELRQKVIQEQSAEDEAARLRGGSGSPMWSPNAILSPREPQNNFSFGKVAFADGEVDVGSGSAVDGKKKGPQDAKTALEAAKKKQDRLNDLDEDKRNNIEEKDRWLNAKKRIQGEKVRDNTSLLKKTLKRQDKGKAKSEKEWIVRIEGVQAGKAAKQRKRDDNLKKRKDEKGSKRGKSKPAPKPKKRPGFEGSWKLGTKEGRGP